MKIKSISPRFVTHLPEALTEGVLYISEEFATAAHLCCCGCGEEVITPLNKANWRLTRSGSEKVSLYPSVGNWRFACRSHYLIQNNKVIESHEMSQGRVDMVLRRDRLEKDRYISEINSASYDINEKSPTTSTPSGKSSLASSIAKLFKG